MMFGLVKKEATTQPLNTLDEIFERISHYGNVNVFQHDDRTFSVNIEFNTIEHCKLTAHSGHKHPTLKAAALAALEKAQEIVISIKRLA